MLTAWTGTSQAQTEVEKRETQAKKECLAGRLQAGIDVLAELYAETNDANYIYNQARCFEQNNRPDEAIGRFKEYLRKVKALPQAERDEVEGHIKDLEAQKAAERAKSAPASGASAPAAPAPINVTVVNPTPVRDEGAARRLRMIGLISAGVGVVAAGAAVAFGIRLQAIEKDVEKDGAAGRVKRTEYNDGQRYETLQWIGYSVAGLTLAGGAVMYYLGSREPTGGESPGVALLPVVSPGHAGAALGMRF